MVCKKYRKLAKKGMSDNKEYIKKEDSESREIAKEFKRKTKLTKKL